jgi:hypothetical protein
MPLAGSTYVHLSARRPHSVVVALGFERRGCDAPLYQTDYGFVGFVHLTHFLSSGFQARHGCMDRSSWTGSFLPAGCLTLLCLQVVRQDG